METYLLRTKADRPGAIYTALLIVVENIEELWSVASAQGDPSAFEFRPAPPHTFIAVNYRVVDDVAGGTVAQPEREATDEPYSAGLGKLLREPETSSLWSDLSAFRPQRKVSSWT